MPLPASLPETGAETATSTAAWPIEIYVAVFSRLRLASGSERRRRHRRRSRRSRSRRRSHIRNRIRIRNGIENEIKIESRQSWIRRNASSSVAAALVESLIVSQYTHKNTQ